LASSWKARICSGTRGAMAFKGMREARLTKMGAARTAQVVSIVSVEGFVVRAHDSREAVESTVVSLEHCVCNRQTTDPNRATSPLYTRRASWDVTA
jgi:hypothetical protein